IRSDVGVEPGDDLLGVVCDDALARRGPLVAQGNLKAIGEGALDEIAWHDGVLSAFVLSNCPKRSRLCSRMLPEHAEDFIEDSAYLDHWAPLSWCGPLYWR